MRILEEHPRHGGGTGSGIGKNVMLKTLLYGFEN